MNRNGYVDARSPAQAEYAEYLRSWRWRVLRWLRLRIDGKRCRMCGTSERLQVHHRSYAHRGGSWWREMLDLTTLCEKHHKEYHDGT